MDQSLQKGMNYVKLQLDQKKITSTNVAHVEQICIYIYFRFHKKKKKILLIEEIEMRYQDLL